MKTVKFNEDGKEINIEVEVWGWLAIYKDGSFLNQFDLENGRFHQFKEIDLENLDIFVMQKHDDPSRRFEIHIKENMTPIHFYRNYILENGKIRKRLYCFGYTEKINGRVSKTLLEIFPNDVISIKNDDKKL